MKKILLLIIFSVLFAVSGFTQVSDVNGEIYPKIIVDSIGNEYVVITIEQARVMDNKLDILKVMEEYNITSSQYDSVCIKVIQEKDVVIAKLEMQINNFTNLANNKDSLIANLQEQVILYRAKELRYEKEIGNKDKEIELHLNRIDNLEKKMLWGGIGGGVVITGLVLLILSGR